jgi:hypothetical protein
VQQRAASRLVQRSLHEPPDCRRVVVGVDGSGSAAALQRAASQARQRNAMLDVVYVLPDGTDARTAATARVMLGEFCRPACPYGAGVPVRLRVERGDPEVVLLLVSAGLADGAIYMLSRSGPPLGRPLAGTITASKIKNLQELRPGSSGTSEIRILFVSGPWRSAILLVAGDKSGKWNRWYAEAIPHAEQLYEIYLKERAEEETAR